VGAEVAYTCPAHQHVFFAGKVGDAPATCPRCGRKLEPFKVMYTCPNPEHAGVVCSQPGVCPKDGRELVPFRGIWLSPEMADANEPAHPEIAKSAAYRCALHPLVHSDHPGDCPICGQPLQAAASVATAADTAVPTRAVPPGAKYVCPMESCWEFSSEPGQCPKCGMAFKPIAEVEWARKIVKKAEATPRFVCPMHPQVTSNTRGTCTICGMQLVSEDAVPRPTSTPAAIAVQMDYLMEHYLALQQRFASDNTKEVALHALGLVGAADELLKRVDDPASELPAQFADSVRALRTAALKLTGKNLAEDRVSFVALSDAMCVLVEQVRPDKQCYPKIYIFHCPMTKGDWLQTSEDMANPFYGFAMLKCGELRTTK